MKNIIERMIRFYSEDLKFQTKLLISHLITVLVPMIVLSLIFVNSYYDFVLNSTLSSEQAISLQASSTLESMLTNIKYTAQKLADDSAAKNIFNISCNETVYELADDEQLNRYYETIKLNISEPYITDIRIYYDEPFSDLKYYNLSGIPIYKSIDTISSSYWHGIFSSTYAQSLLCPSLYLSPSEIRDNGSLAYIIRIPYRDSIDKTAAFIAVYFSEESISSVLAQNISINDSASYILNSRDSFVASSDKRLTGAYFLSLDNLFEITKSENVFATSSFMQENLYVGYHLIENTDWYMITAIPMNDAMGKGFSVILKSIIFYSFFVIMAFIISLKLSKSISNRISGIAVQMKTAHLGHPEKIMQKKVAHDEIGQLIETYNYMTDEINELLKKQQEAAKELRKSEFAALQAQINPHFLYNSLDMINWLSQSDRKEEAGHAIQTLSKFYKLTLSRKNTMDTVEKELEHARLYVELQNMRYENCIDLVIDVPLNLMECTMPKLVFQPILENCILHGIMVKPDKHGVIVIAGWIDGPDAVFLISDDGVGMNETQLNSVLSGTGSSHRGSNIGIFNTHNRLQLLYGDSYGLSYESEVGRGTEVTVRMPYLENENHMV